MYDTCSPPSINNSPLPPPLSPNIAYKFSGLNSLRMQDNILGTQRHGRKNPELQITRTFYSKYSLRFLFLNSKALTNITKNNFLSL